MAIWRFAHDFVLSRSALLVARLWQPAGLVASDDRRNLSLFDDDDVGIRMSDGQLLATLDVAELTRLGQIPIYACCMFYYLVLNL